MTVLRREGWSTGTRWIAAAVAVAFGITLGLGIRAASGQDRNFAGSAQGSYVFVPTDPEANDQAFDGFTTELTLKLIFDFTDHVSANVKTCYGCHGFEIDMAYVDLRISDELNFRAGRFNPAFGEFPLRHDPANHRTVDKPLPYDMGRMLRLREWNLGVFPSPYVDNGIEANGTRWVGDDLQLDYAVWAVGGFRGTADDVDINWIQMRSGDFYYVDNNSTPAVGGRFAATVTMGDDVMFGVGASGMWGTYDPDNERSYAVIGADTFLRIGQTDLRAEYLVRRTEMALGDNPFQRFRYGPDNDGDFADYFLKEGWYVELNSPLTDHLEMVARFDGLRRTGNVVVTSPLRAESLILRYTAGVSIAIDRGFRLKLSSEFWDFSDFDDEISVGGALVAVF